MMKEIHVKTATRTYPVLIQKGLISQVGSQVRDRLGRSFRAAVVTNPTVGGYYAQAAIDSFSRANIHASIVEIPDGEQHKTLDTVRDLYARFLELDLDRGDLVAALGGGVVGDIAGFAAATYLRGVSFVQMPTSLLAMVDASIGGKTGVDLEEGKNLVGAFKQPEMVSIDPDVLETLPPEELAAGMAEVVKHGLIGAPALFEQLERGRPQDHGKIIEQAVRVKAEIVEKDTFEKGPRALLNLGHTFGHAMELLSDYRVRHGQAVALGLIAAAKMAALLGLCDPALVSRVETAVEAQGLPTRTKGYTAERIIAAMRHDKKRREQILRFVVPRAPGHTEIIDRPDNSVIEGAVAHILED